MIKQNIRASDHAVSDATDSPLLSSPQLGQPAQVMFCSSGLNHLELVLMVDSAPQISSTPRSHSCPDPSWR